ncbi:trypsin-like serine protease [Streptomyces sp. NPDC013457]|uniref:trypsin-like serine protease n=1 Tax=Streptomyces sp. NPDC013457 TaxID=3364866 RepID=UPI0036FB17DC
MPSTEEALRSALEVITIPPGTNEIEELDPGSRAAALSASPWVSGPNITGLGVATKMENGQPTERLALVAYVKRKEPIFEIPGDRRIPDRITIPEIGEIETDVQSIGEMRLESFTERVRPIAPGYSLSHSKASGGTLGCLVRKTGDPSTSYVLSNSHVLARSGRASKEDVILQPGPKDGGGAQDVIAHLKEWVSFDFEPGYNNLCDAAIAAVSTDATVTTEIPVIGRVKGVTANLKRGMTVQKSGRTTGHTLGIVRDIDYRTFMPIVKADGTYGSAGFRNQVLCERYTDSGDSGSLVCDMEGMAVGLHWCGSASASVFSPLNFVLDSMEIELVT